MHGNSKATDQSLYTFSAVVEGILLKLLEA